MPKRKKTKKLRGVFDSLPNASQYTGWNTGAGMS